MPELILRCNYLKQAPQSHLKNFVKYLGTREGVEKLDDTVALLPATVKQKELIADIIQKIDDTKRMHEYYDYLNNPTRENASEFITQALESNMDVIAKKKNYIDYLANRPRVERIGTHGLFSYAGESVVLSKVADEVANHKGVIWTNVISLRREDAQRLGYDHGEQWRELIRSKVDIMSENYKIDSSNLKWYAAFHNESHHPHVHLVVYSVKPSEGFLTKSGIEAMRSELAHGIFRQDFMSIYEKKTEQRKEIKNQTESTLQLLLGQMRTGSCNNPVIAEQMQLLSKRLQNTSGKKVYGYLKTDVKKIVDGIVEELAKEEAIAQCYEKWLESTRDILRTYTDKLPEQNPLSKQKELKSIKNMVIAEAVKLGSCHFLFDDDRCVSMEENAINNCISDLSAEQENEFSAYRLGRLYLEGEVFEQNIEKAVTYLTQSADLGNAYAQYAIGKLYLSGKEVEQDKEKAEHYLQLSAGQGNTYAQFLLDNWNDTYGPDAMLMATRLMHQLENLFNEQIAKSAGIGMADKKLRRKMQEKKVLQGHAQDDYAMQFY